MTGDSALTPDPWITEQTLLEVGIPLLTFLAWHGQINHQVSTSMKSNEGLKHL